MAKKRGAKNAKTKTKKRPAKRAVNKHSAKRAVKKHVVKKARRILKSRAPARMKKHSLARKKDPFSPAALPWEKSKDEWKSEWDDDFADFESDSGNSEY